MLVGREYSFPPAFIDKVNQLGQPHGITAEYVTLSGSPMDEPQRYKVIVDRISHEVEYYRGFLKLAVLSGTYVINNPFWWTADDKFFNYALMARLGVAIPRTVLLPQKAYPQDVDIQPASLRNMGYPLDWDGLLDYTGRPAILKPFSGGGWKHVYKVHSREELLAAYDGTAPYCMTLQQFVHFDKYVRCFTFGKHDIVPVVYDPHARQYLIQHDYLSAEVGARVVKDAQTINEALGYEMNTIEFGIENDVPYAIDFLNPAPDFERDRITPFYFEMVVDKMARLCIDRALNGHQSNMFPKWEQMLGLGAASGFVGSPFRRFLRVDLKVRQSPLHETRSAEAMTSEPSARRSHRPSGRRSVMLDGIAESRCSIRFRPGCRCSGRAANSPSRTGTRTRSTCGTRAWCSAVA